MSVLLCGANFFVNLRRKFDNCDICTEKNIAKNTKKRIIGYCAIFDANDPCFREVSTNFKFSEDLRSLHINGSLIRIN